MGLTKSILVPKVALVLASASNGGIVTAVVTSDFEQLVSTNRKYKLTVFRMVFEFKMKWFKIIN